MSEGKPTRVLIGVVLNYPDFKPAEGDFLLTPLEIELKPNMEYVGKIYYEDGTIRGIGVSKSDKIQTLVINYIEETNTVDVYVKADE